MLIDSHCHIDSEEFTPDFDAVLNRSSEAGVDILICIGASGGFKSATSATKLAATYPNIYCSVGIHPNDAETPFDINKLAEFSKLPKVVAIGETGLDYYWNKASKENQVKWFEAQIELAKSEKKPIIVHARDSLDDCLSILKQNNADEVGGVFHCYTGDLNFALKAIDYNFMISFTGILTFKNAHALREVAKTIPLKSIMVETDAPYMAPEPYRGKRAEPAHTLEVAKKLAEIRGLEFNECIKILAQNTKTFFNLN